MNMELTNNEDILNLKERLKNGLLFMLGCLLVRLNCLNCCYKIQWTEIYYYSRNLFSYTSGG